MMKNKMKLKKHMMTTVAATMALTTLIGCSMTAIAAPAKKVISIETAKELALKEMNVKDAVFTEQDYESDDGVYELEFTVGNIEYEVDVNAYTGKVIKADHERHHGRDDRRWDDDWDDDSCRWDD